MSTMPHLPNSQYRPIHGSTNPALTAALADVPDWVLARDMLVRFAASRPTRVQRGSLTENLEAVITENLEAGKPIPENIVETAATYKATIDAENDLAASLSVIHEHLVNRLDGAIQTHGAALFKHLNTQLTDVIDQARDLGEAADLTSAEDAIAADRVDDWRTITGLMATYADIRAAQASLRVRRVDGFGEVVKYPEVLHLANPDDVFSDWASWTSPGYLEDGHGRRQQLDAPWPDDLASGDALLWFAANPTAEAWVPSKAQLDKVTAQLKDLQATGTTIKRSSNRLTPDARGRAHNERRSSERVPATNL